MTRWTRRAPLLGATLVALLGCKRSELPESEPEVETPEATAAGGDAAPAEPSITSPLLWEVTDPDGGDVGYLFGTIHSGVDANEDLPPIVWERLEASDIFAMESDLRDTAKLSSMLMRNDDTSLREEIGDEAWETLVEVVGPTKAREYNQLHVAIAVMGLSDAELPTTPYMDIDLLFRAEEEELEIVYLEELAHQMELVMRYLTKDVLLDLLEDPEEIATEVQALLDAYIAGDAEALAELVLNPQGWDSAPEGGKEAFLDDRNASWVPQIRELIARGTPFVAVGAAHLVGEGSVIDLLRHDGYEIRRLGPE